MSAAISLQNATVVRDGNVILNQISIDIPSNTLSIVFGPNGAGKSSLLKVITGDLSLSSGTVEVLSKRPSEVRTEVAYIEQFPQLALSAPISVYDTVKMGLIFCKQKFSIAEIHGLVENQLEVLGLENCASKQLNTLSGGQFQRALLARALVRSPKILLLDEATSGVDVGIKEGLFSLLEKLKSMMTILFVTHDVSVVSESTDLVLCLNKDLVSHGSPKDALSHEALTCMYGSGIAAFSHCHAPHVHVPSHRGSS